MPSPLTDVDHLEQVFRSLTPDERAAATALIPVASAMVRAEVPSVDARIDAGTLDPVLPANAVENMVQRVLIGRGRPEGAASGTTSTSLGTFVETETTTYLSPAALAGQLEVLPSDLVGIVPRTPVGRVGTIDVKPPIHRHHARGGCW